MTIGDKNMLKNKVGVLSVDPGKMTGVALFGWSGEPEDSPEVLYSGEVNEEEFADVIKSLLSKKEEFEEFKVVAEQFTINLQTAKKSQAPFSLEQIGVLKYLCRESKIYEISFQSPVDAKNMFPNPKLKKLEIWHKGGEGHALDALRHGLLLLVKSKWIPRALFDQ
jgi:hypothetical protein